MGVHFSGWSSRDIEQHSLDWVARRYVETHLNFYVLNMLTVPSTDHDCWERIGKLAARLSCVDERFADFAAEAGVEYGPLAGAQHNDLRRR